MVKQPKQRTCKVCKAKFLPTFNTIQPCCSIQCAIEQANTKKLTQERIKTRQDRRETKERLKTLADHLREAQAVFNAWVRERDKLLPCISCGTQKPDIQYCAGHYRTRGAAKHLTFNPVNVNKQCNRHCNLAKSGNIAAYRVGLIAKYGEQAVIDLENNNETHRYTIEEAKAIKVKYKQLLKDLK